MTVTAEVEGKPAQSFVEPIKTVITFTLKNGYKLMYLVKFIGINNFYGLEPLVIDKARHPTNMIDFFMVNRMDEGMEFKIMDIKGNFHLSFSQEEYYSG